MPIGSELCTSCGLCCNGTLMHGFRAASDEEAARLVVLGLRPREPRIFPQPCAALQGSSCSIYEERPIVCRNYACGLLRSFTAGRIPLEAARRAIQETEALEGLERRRHLHRYFLGGDCL